MLRDGVTMASKRQWIAVGIILTILGVAVVAGMALTPDVRPIRPGVEAPGFEAVNVATGDTVNLSDYRGEVVLLNLWATFCAPCEQEMPSMQRLYDELGPHGLKIVAVSLDDAESDFVLDWTTKRHLTFDILHDRSGRVERLYQITGWPESFVIDRDGVIVKKEWGAREWDGPAASAIFRRMLGLEVESPAN